jgi:hypothetical protein
LLYRVILVQAAERAMAIKSFADGFVKTARPIAQTIIRERSQPVHTQTYKPVPDGARTQSPPSPLLIAMLTFGFWTPCYHQARQQHTLSMA